MKHNLWIGLGVLCFITVFSYPIFLVIVIPAGLVLLIHASVKSNKANAEAAKLEHNDRVLHATNQFTELVALHMDALHRKYLQKIFKDDYGKYNFDQWFDEVNYFIDEVAVSEHPEFEELVTRKQMSKLIDDAIDIRLRSNSFLHGDVEEMSGIDFEHHCSQILVGAGWDTVVTKASGDQGVDIIGTIRGTRAVFQCKRYGQPVGNGAVQEVIAAKLHEPPVPI